MTSPSSLTFKKQKSRLLPLFSRLQQKLDTQTSARGIKSIILTLQPPEIIEERVKREGEYFTVKYKRGEMLEREGMACYWKLKEVDTNKLWTCKLMPSLQKMTKEEHRVFHNHLNIV